MKRSGSFRLSSASGAKRCQWILIGRSSLVRISHFASLSTSGLPRGPDIAQPREEAARRNVDVQQHALVIAPGVHYEGDVAGGRVGHNALSPTSSSMTSSAPPQKL